MARPPQRQSIRRTWIVFLLGNPKNTIIGLGIIVATIAIFYGTNHPEDARLAFQAAIGIIIAALGISLIYRALFPKKSPPPKKNNQRRRH